MHLKIKTAFFAAVIVAIASVGVFSFGQFSTSQARTVQPASVLGDLFDTRNVIDGNTSTRASSGRVDYAGWSVSADLNSEQYITGVIQDHGRWSEDYPGSYRIDVASATAGPWTEAFSGQGRSGESRATFAARRGRFIRITATGRRGGGDEWSIAELRIIVDPFGRPGPRPDLPGSRRLLRDLSYATDNNTETRASSQTPDYAGMAVVLDLGSEDRLSRVVQLHGRWAEDYPAEYKVEVSRRDDDDDYREVWRGRGETDRSTASFNPVTARYVRITALRNRDTFHWWSIAELRTSRDSGPFDRGDDDGNVDRPIRRVTARCFSNPDAVLGRDTSTRATTGRADYVGCWIQVELFETSLVSRVLQVHAPNAKDYPGRYIVEVSQDGRRWQKVWQGDGADDRSRANFDPVRARYVRITATDTGNERRWWSISTLKVSGER